jgi:hypothetical protein
MKQSEISSGIQVGFQKTFKNGKVRGKTDRYGKIIPKSRRGRSKSSLTIVDKFKLWTDNNTTKVIGPERTTGQVWNNVTRQVRWGGGGEGLDREYNDT